MPQDQNVTIIVEGTPHEWPKNTDISHEQVVALEVGTPDPNTVYAVTYHRAHGEKEGTLAPGASVKVKEGMIFNVSETGQS